MQVDIQRFSSGRVQRKNGRNECQTQRKQEAEELGVWEKRFVLFTIRRRQYLPLFIFGFLVYGFIYGEYVEQYDSMGMKNLCYCILFMVVVHANTVQIGFCTSKT